MLRKRGYPPGTKIGWIGRGHPGHDTGFKVYCFNGTVLDKPFPFKNPAYDVKYVGYPPTADYSVVRIGECWKSFDPTPEESWEWEWLKPESEVLLIGTPHHCVHWSETLEHALMGDVSASADMGTLKAEAVLIGSLDCDTLLAMKGIKP